MGVLVAASERSVLGEAPIWRADRQELCWLDFAASRLHVLGSGSHARSTMMDIPAPLGGAVLGPDGALLVLSGRTLYRLDDRTDRATRVASFPLSDGTHVNDAEVDASGSLWISTADDGEVSPSGVVVRYSATGESLTLPRRFPVANGPAFSPDGAIVYVSDSVHGCVRRYGNDGRELAPLVEFGDCLPDGISVDALGSVWVALWGGGRVACYRPTGELQRELVLPTPLVTSVAFGGPGLRNLFITTALAESGSDDPAELGSAGRLFVADVEIPGPAPTRLHSSVLARWADEAR